MITFISSEVIIQEFVLEYKNLFEENKTNTSVLYSTLRLCLSKLPNQYKPTKKIKIYLDTYDYLLPSNFDKIKNIFFESLTDKEDFEYSINNNKIFSNKKDLSLDIEYYCLMEDNFSYDIIDNETIIKWIKLSFLEKVYRLLYFNGHPDVFQRWQASKQLQGIDETKAKSLMMRSGLKEIYRITNALIEKNSGFFE